MPKTPEELEADRLAAETAAASDSTTDDEGATDDAAAAAAAAAETASTGNPEVDKLVKAAVSDAVSKAVTAALNQQRETAEREAAEKTAREQGDYKSLFERSEKERVALELNKWRGEALIAAGLDNKWFDSIQGNTLEEMTEFAKKFKKNLDAEIKARGEQIVEESPGTPRGAGKGSRQRSDNKGLTPAQKTDQTLRHAFGTSRLASR